MVRKNRPTPLSKVLEAWEAPEDPPAAKPSDVMPEFVDSVEGPLDEQENAEQV